MRNLAIGCGLYEVETRFDEKRNKDVKIKIVNRESNDKFDPRKLIHNELFIDIKKYEKNNGEIAYSVANEREISIMEMDS